MTKAIMTPRQWLLLVVLSLLWGSSFLFNEMAIASLSALTIVFARSLLAAVGLSLYVYFSGQSFPTQLEQWRSFFVMGAINNLLPFSLIVWGQTHIESSLAAILNATTPIVAVVLAIAFVPEERPTFNRLFGTLLGFFGITVLLGWEVLQGFNLGSLGQLAVLGAALCYATAGIYGRRFRTLSPTVVSAGMLTGTATLLLPLILIFDRPWLWRPDGSALLAILGLALLGTALAYLLYFRLLAAVGATSLLLVAFLIPLSAIALGTVFLGERVSLRQVVGMLLIFSGLVAIDGRVFAAIRPKFH